VTPPLTGVVRVIAALATVGAAAAAATTSSPTAPRVSPTALIVDRAWAPLIGVDPRQQPDYLPSKTDPSSWGERIPSSLPSSLKRKTGTEASDLDPSWSSTVGVRPRTCAATTCACGSERPAYALAEVLRGGRTIRQRLERPNSNKTRGAGAEQARRRQGDQRHHRSPAHVHADGGQHRAKALTGAPAGSDALGAPERSRGRERARDQWQ
jgi:hypothetical protein